MKMTPTFAECVLVRRHWLTVERSIILFAYCLLWPHQITYTVSWSKDAVDGALPPKCFDQNGVLTIPNLRPEDEGKYFCTASNQFETKFKEVSLQVGGKRYRRQSNRQIIKHFFLLASCLVFPLIFKSVLRLVAQRDNRYLLGLFMPHYHTFIRS